MKKTQYFEYTRNRPDRVTIQDEWIVSVMNNPEHVEVQVDGRIRKWGFVPEVGKYLRIILLEDDETVHNAFFDRSYKKG